MTSRVLTPDEVGLPIVRALGLGGFVASVTLHVEAARFPTLTVVYEARAGEMSPARGVVPEELERVLQRYRLVPIAADAEPSR